MFKNYLKIFFRNLWKHAGYSICNVTGLAIGMVTCILILLFVRYEFNWNTSNKNYERIYRVQQKVIFKNNVDIYGQTGFALAAEMKNKFPEIEQVTPAMELWDEYLSSSDDLTLLEKNGFYAYNEIAKIFSFNFLKGDPLNALSEPFSIALSKKLADKYFPGQNAYGKTIKSSRNKYLKVTGIFDDLPLNSDFRPEYLVSFSTFKQVTDWKDFDELKNIDNGVFRTFVLLKPGIDAKLVNSKLHGFMDSYVTSNNKKLYLKPLSEIHLTAGENSDIVVAFYYMAGIAVFVLVLACINFINLATANSFLRNKEIGIRKVVGASRSSLFKQFIGESLFFTIAAIVLSFMLVELFLPSFSTMVKKQLSLNYFKDINFILGIISVFLLTGFLSGIYPAVILSSFKPSDIIKGNVSVPKRKKDYSKSFFRKSLVTFQFFISITLIIGTIYVMKQVDFMKNKDYGFTKENLLICRVFGEGTDANFQPLRSKLLRNPAITDASVSINAPFYGNWGKEINWEDALQNEKIGILYNSIDYNYVPTFDMKMVLGRNFSEKFSTDSQACIINETAMRELGWNDPLGKTIDSNKFTIVGVVKDFHPYSAHVRILPFYMTLNSGKMKDAGIYAIRIKPGTRHNAVSYIKAEFRKFFPGNIIEVNDFVNENFSFGTEDVWEVVNNVFSVFSIIAILIAANGLFGLVSFAAQRKIKEIGIRKVLGAKASGLYILVSKEFLIILIIALILAIPCGYIISVTTPGAYKYKLQFIDYFLAVGLMFITAFTATIYQTTKAVLSNPVDSLKYE